MKRSKDYRSRPAGDEKAKFKCDLAYRCGRSALPNARA